MNPVLRSMNAALRRCALLLLWLLPALALAQGANDAIFKYNGPDREQRLIAGAKKEGVATMYTSLEIGRAHV